MTDTLNSGKRQGSDPIPPKFCLEGDKDCYQLFTTLITSVNTQKIQIDRLVSALLGDEYNPEGYVTKIQKLEKRIKVLEVVYIGATAVITVGGVVISMLDKIKIVVT